MSAGWEAVQGPRRWLRLVLVPLLLVPLVVIGAPFQALLLRLAPRHDHHLPRFFHRVVLALLDVRVVTVGELAPARPLLLVGNHVSWLDIMVMGSLGRLTFVAKAEIAGWPVFGALARLQRTIFVDRGRRAETAAVSSALRERLLEGDPVVLFAEGTTGDGNRVLPFRSSLLAAASGGVDASVQPFAIAYTRQDGLPLTRARRPGVAWYGGMELLPHLVGVITGGPLDVEVRLGEPLPAMGDRKALARLVEEDVRRMATEALTGRRLASPSAMDAL